MTLALLSTLKDIATYTVLKYTALLAALIYPGFLQKLRSALTQE